MSMFGVAALTISPKDGVGRDDGVHDGPQRLTRTEASGPAHSVTPTS